MTKSDRDESVNAFEDSLWIVGYLQSQIAFATSLFEEVALAGEERETFTLSNWTQLLLASFLEEWKRLQSCGSDPAVRASLRVAKPFIDKLTRWESGLRAVRSKILAHPCRNDDGTIALPWEVLAAIDAPTNHAEVLLLGWCAVDAASVMLAHHRECHERSKARMPMRAAPERGVRTQREAMAELMQLRGASALVARASGLADLSYNGPPYPRH